MLEYILNSKCVNKIANKLYEKYSKVNIEKIYHKLNEQIDRQN